MNRASIVAQLDQYAPGLEVTEAGDGWPTLGSVELEGVVLPLALWIGLVTRSHRKRDEHERRLQNPGRNRPILPIEGHVPLVLGVWVQDDLIPLQAPVIVAADPRRRMGRNTRFSIFIRVTNLIEAAAQGWSTAEDDRENWSVAAAPQRFLDVAQFAVDQRSAVTAPSALTGDRMNDIQVLAMEGLTLEAIATQVGVTRERVRQILRDRYPEIDVERKRRSAERRAAHGQRVVADSLRQRLTKVTEELHDGGIRAVDVMEHLRTTRSSSSTARALKTSEALVRELHAAHAKPFPIASVPSTGARRHSDEQIVEYLRLAAAELGVETMSHTTYEEFASRQRLTVESWPSHQTVAKRFGGWSAACDAAGLQVRQQRRTYVQDFPPARCRAAVDRYVAECLNDDRRPSYGGYEKWARANGGPSGPTVRNRTGSWGEALASSLRRVGQA